MRKEAKKQLSRMEMMHPDSSEATIIRTYIDWILDVPWAKGTTDRLDLMNAKKVLDEDHYGLEKVKERILEYLAVRKLNKSTKGPDPLFRRASRGRQDLARSVHCQGHGPQISPHFARRHAGRSGDPRAPANLYRRHAGPHHPGVQDGRHQ